VQQDSWRHPFDDEPDEDQIEELLRDSRKKAIRLMSAIIDEMPDCPEKYGIAYAIGSTTLAGRSMSEIAAKLGVTRALISARAVAFCDRHGIPPSPYMKASR
jgi:hypothetical protein